jgi:adenine-specific DNA methylase
MLKKYGELKIKPIEYVAYRASRNLDKRNKHTTEYIFTLKKENKIITPLTII